MSHAQRFEAALRSPEPARALRAVVQELALEGCQKSNIYSHLEKFLFDLRVREDHCEADEDAVLDVMDALTGWCHPDARFLPEQKIA